VIFGNTYFDLVIASEVLYYPNPINTAKFLKNLKSRFLLTSNTWNACFKVENIIRRSGFILIKSKWIKAIEDMNFKMTKISLWERVSFKSSSTTNTKSTSV